MIRRDLADIAERVRAARDRHGEDFTCASFPITDRDALFAEVQRLQQRLSTLADLAGETEDELHDYIVHDAVTTLITACKGGKG